MWTRKPIGIQKKLTIGCLVLFALICLLVAPVFLRAYHEFFAFSHPDLRQIEKLTTLKFPANAVLLGSYFGAGMQERQLYAVIKVNQADVKQYVNWPGADSVEPTVLNNIDSTDMPWWRLKGARNKKGIAITPENRYTMYLVADLDDSKNAVLYLFWMGRNTL